LGSPQFVVAPMVDNSELAFRMQTRKYGAHVVYTQMFNANIFSVSKECRTQLFESDPEDRPLFVQIAGHDPQVMLEAARFVEDHCDAVDINLGCPQGIAKRGRYGAFLMEELDLLYDIVSTLVKGLKVPVTCKTRIYKDFDRSIRLCETLVKAGASVITIHGRTREEKGQAVGRCDWDMIRRIKEYFTRQDIPVPVIANGGIETVDDIYRCIEYTGVDAVMTSEAVLENPAVFSRRLNVEGREMTQIDLTGKLFFSISIACI
jgi:tRNA-dihydrouridine synthase 1